MWIFGRQCPYCQAKINRGDIFCFMCGQDQDIEMEICTKCGKRVPRALDYCGYCASPITIRKRSYPKIRCDSCSTVIPPYANFCSKCGGHVILQHIAPHYFEIAEKSQTPQRTPQQSQLQQQPPQVSTTHEQPSSPAPQQPASQTSQEPAAQSMTEKAKIAIEITRLSASPVSARLTHAASAPPDAQAMLILPNGEKWSLKGDRTFGRVDFERVLPHDEIAKISREHFRIYGDGSRYFLEDVGSSNGTKLNGVQMTPKVSAALLPGSRITLADRTVLVFVYN